MNDLKIGDTIWVFHFGIESHDPDEIYLNSYGIINELAVSVYEDRIYYRSKKEALNALAKRLKKLLDRED